MPDELHRMLHAWLDAQADEFNHCEGCEYDCRCLTCPEMVTILAAVVELHKPEWNGGRQACGRCFEGGPGYEAEPVTYPCETVTAIAKGLGIEWADGAPRWKAADTVTLLEDVLAKHPDGEEIARVVTGNLARAAVGYAKALEPAPAPKPAQFLDGCRKVDASWIHGRPHDCPTHLRGR